jgi:hypothetical protein
MFSFFMATTAPPSPPTYTWCIFQLIQTNTSEMISTAYGMGNVPSSTNFTALCQAFYTRDIRAEDKPLELVSLSGINSQVDPDGFWLANTWRRPLTAEEKQTYDCFVNKSTGSVLSSKVLDLMPNSPDSIRIPALMISAINSVNSPILRYAAVVTYTTALPLLTIGGLVKAWRLVRK